MKQLIQLKRRLFVCKEVLYFYFFRNCYYFLVSLMRCMALFIKLAKDSSQNSANSAEQTLPTYD